jgi:hypothetical protein
MSVLRSAIQAVPAVKYALGVAGVGAAAALTTQFFNAPGVALASTGIMLLMMVLLVVFAALVGISTSTPGGAKASPLYYPAMFFTWAMLILSVGSAALVCTCVFFSFPKPLGELIGRASAPTRFTLRVETVDGSGHPVGGAHVIARGHAYVGDQHTGSDGMATFDDVSSADSHLVVTGSAPGDVDAQSTIDVAASMTMQLVLAAAPPAATAPPAKPVPPPASAPTTTVNPARHPQSLTDELRGTWEPIVTGAIANARVRNGTFDFTPQPDGEILVTATFAADGSDSKLTGTASVVGSRVFMTFKATTDVGGSWDGHASFDHGGQGRLSGRLKLKNGDEAPIELRKIGR